jgi:hypothetical protein
VSLDAALIEALSAIQPYLGDAVLAGGWAPKVYLELSAASQGSGLLTTRDIDIVLPRTLPVRDLTLDELLTKAGFSCELRSVETVPVMHFIARRDAPDEVEVEFITTASGSRDGPIEVQRGLTAQAVKFGHLLVENKWPVSLRDLTDGILDGTLSIPTPAAFALNKTLTFSRRRDRAKREKDLYYIFYVVASFPEWHPWMIENLRAIAASRPRWVKRAAGAANDVSGSIDASGIAAIVRQRPGSAYAALDDEQFGQYAISIMQIWLDMLRGATLES